MVPFSTAERKVLGVAAPSQEQVPLNWAYPPAPNPYNFKQRLTGFVNSDLRAGGEPGAGAAGDRPGDRDAHAPTSDSRGGRQ